MNSHERTDRDESETVPRTESESASEAENPQQQNTEDNSQPRSRSHPADASENENERERHSSQHSQQETTPRFDPARDLEAMREHADVVANAALTGAGRGVGEDREGDEGDGSIGYQGDTHTSREDAFEDGYAGGYEHGYTEGFLAGLESRTGLGSRVEWDPAGLAETSRRGVLLTGIAAVLAAVGYYGLLAIQTGATEFGTALPTPVYILSFAVLFVLGMVPNLREGITGLATAVAFAALFALLLSFAVEGAVVLVEQPSLATEGAQGAAVLGGALVAAFLCYWGLLSAIDWDARKRTRAAVRQHGPGGLRRAE